MDSRVTFREIITACLVITAFTVTGIMIMNENYKYALISLSAAAFFVLMLFLALVAGEEDKILDLSNPSLRNPRKSALSKKKVTYVDRITPDLGGLVSQSKSEKSKTKGKRKSGSSKVSRRGDDGYKLEDMSGDFYESVGNMRVYQRGEKIELNHDDDDDLE